MIKTMFKNYRFNPKFDAKKIIKEIVKEVKEKKIHTTKFGSDWNLAHMQTLNWILDLKLGTKVKQLYLCRLSYLPFYLSYL